MAPTDDNDNDNDNDNDARCDLNPAVRLGDVASWTISRVLSDGNGGDILATLPYRWPADTRREDVGACAGGGLFRAQPRGRHGRYLKGVAPLDILLDGNPREFEPPGAVPTIPGAAPAAVVPDVPAHVSPSSGSGGAGVLSVPVAAPLPGMPGAMLDFPGLPPEVRALMQAFQTQHAYSWAAVERAGTAEQAATQRVADVALKSLEETGRAINSGLGRAVTVLTEQLEFQRNRCGALEADNLSLRSDLSQARAELAELRLRVSLNLPAGAAPRKGWLEVLEGVMLEGVRSVGVPAVAKLLGVEPESLRALEAKASAS